MRSMWTSCAAVPSPVSGDPDARAARVGIDQHFLGGGDPVGHQLCGDGTLCLTMPSASGASSWCRALVPTKPAGLAGVSDHG
jgi:hypothetical protein